MRHLSIALVATTSTIALTQIASAADLLRKAPPAPVIAPAPSWTGFYIGANIGGGWGSRHVDYVPNDPISVILFNAGAWPPPSSFDTSGLIGGLQVGYNWQFSTNWLIGFEADLNWSGINSSGSSSFNFLTENVDEDIKWFGTVRGRLGYLPTNSLLVYATGGFAYGRVEHSASVSSSFVGQAIVAANVGGFSINCIGPATCYSGSSSDIATGWTVGGGLEYALWRNFTLKAEYLYVSLGSEPVTQTALVVFPGTTPSSVKANFGRTDFNIARVGLNYRF